MSTADHRASFDTDAVDFGRLLLKYRKRRRLTQAELSGLSTVSVRAIRNLEQGQVGAPRRDTVRLLSDALRLNAQERVEFDRATGAEPGGALLETDALRAPSSSQPLRGREQEVAAVLKHVLGEHEQLIAVTGFAGVGKTRVAMAVAQALEACETPSVLWVAVRQDSDNSVVDGLASSIGDRSVLVVLDGNDTDQVSVATMRSLVRECPNLRILETTRTPRVESSDYHLALRPLPVTEPFCAGDAPAVALLLDLVADLQLGFVADPPTLGAFAEICRQLDGLPRALEAAAAWFTILSTDELVRMARTDPQLLATPPGSDVDADTSVPQAVVAQPPAARDLLTGLSHWRDPWTVRDVVLRTGMSWADVARSVHSLLGHGLIAQVTSDDDLVRFTVLNIVRAYLRRTAEAVA
ncbi:helix-turn-helix domain-containing protein [Actinocrispum wychmicini]|uniref:helix-turn-helix domain-containing protein n=1 Tax=Actinocrispum wychmicini TaxID=1213861 RepID=UPI00140531B3|nr:helix-turn-helix domain-containing protein [Actinocrispum wychmicini]